MLDATRSQSWPTAPDLAGRRVAGRGHHSLRGGRGVDRERAVESTQGNVRVAEGGELAHPDPLRVWQRAAEAAAERVRDKLRPGSMGGPDAHAARVRAVSARATGSAIGSPGIAGAASAATRCQPAGRPRTAVRSTPTRAASPGPFLVAGAAARNAARAIPASTMPASSAAITAASGRGGRRGDGRSRAVASVTGARSAAAPRRSCRAEARRRSSMPGAAPAAAPFRAVAAARSARRRSAGGRPAASPCRRRSRRRSRSGGRRCARGRPRRRVGHMRVQHRGVDVAREGDGAGQALVQHGGERVDVGRRPGRLAVDLLGRRVVDRADEVAAVGEGGVGVRAGRGRSRPNTGSRRPRPGCSEASRRGARPRPSARRRARRPPGRSSRTARSGSIPRRAISSFSVEPSTSRIARKRPSSSSPAS